MEAVAASEPDPCQRFAQRIHVHMGPCSKVIALLGVRIIGNVLTARVGTNRTQCTSCVRVLVFLVQSGILDH
jgi:hypothetical protein